MAIFGVHRVWLLAEYLRDRKSNAHLKEREGPLPFVTVQLPMYNEGAVAERLLRAAARFDYPLDAFEIQVLDDSNDECSEICARRSLTGSSLHVVNWWQFSTLILTRLVRFCATWLSVSTIPRSAWCKHDGPTSTATSHG